MSVESCCSSFMIRPWSPSIVCGDSRQEPHSDDVAACGRPKRNDRSGYLVQIATRIPLGGAGAARTGLASMRQTPVLISVMRIINLDKNDRGLDQNEIAVSFGRCDARHGLCIFQTYSAAVLRISRGVAPYCCLKQRLK